MATERWWCSPDGSSLIAHVGFFHFVETYEVPLGELTRSLTENLAADRVGYVLVVLPEGFNLGRKYNVDPRFQNKISSKRPMFDAHYTLQLLSDLARVQSVMFVVGLIEVDSATGTKSNCAYFVDAENPPTLMCRKMNDDHSGEYEPCKIYCQGVNPLEAGDLRLGALLCMDAECQIEMGDEVRRNANVRRRKVLSELGKDHRSVLCIPGAFSTERLWENNSDLEGNGVVIVNVRSKWATRLGEMRM